MNQAFTSLHGESLEITFTVLLNQKKKCCPISLLKFWHFLGWRRGLGPRLFLYYLRVRLGSDNFWAERWGSDGLGGRASQLGRARGPGAAARSPSSRHSGNLKTATPFPESLRKCQNSKYSEQKSRNLPLQGYKYKYKNIENRTKIKLR